MKWFIPFILSLSLVLASESSDTTLAEKSPSRAVLYSLIPGGGQIYNGKYFKAVLIFSAEVYMAYQFQKNSVDYERSGSHRSLEKRNKYAWWVGFVYVYNLLDALVDGHLSTFEFGEFEEEVSDAETNREMEEPRDGK